MNLLNMTSIVDLVWLTVVDYGCGNNCKNGNIFKVRGKPLCSVFKPRMVYASALHRWSECKINCSRVCSAIIEQRPDGVLGSKCDSTVKTKRKIW